MQNSALENRKKVALFQYDFEKDGGAVGDITLRGPSIPDGALVDFGLIDVQTAPTSGGAATIALELASAGDVKAATAIASFATGPVSAVPDKTAGNAIKLAANASLTMTIAAADLTAGKIVVALEYFMTE
ncbi:hypothetical protein [Desulforhopalus singaporensis]|uniref:Uncharacterized protein n=1 Tax=Desulforhopalus singaporensis TaxID=91360 RepID=A0A1H0NTF7_9BACT|nr:hypothetical protein [Desulforhopalus singaporensis]SDO95690.1 hypothetical protein SAMN05660330_01429 [Desulforhopalus singaporensis]